MRPYIEMNGKRYHLQKEVDPHRFEVGVLEVNGSPEFLLCPKVKQRFRQATGAALVIDGHQLNLVLNPDGKIIQRTFPLKGLEIFSIQIDWNASSTSVGSLPPSGQKDADETENR